MKTPAECDCTCPCTCDRRLLAQLAAADPALRRQGWEAWYRRDAPALLAFLDRRCRRLGSQEQSEDLLQDCFLIAVRRIAGGGYVEQDKRLIAYLLGIAKNLLRTLHRRQRRAPLAFVEQEVMEGVGCSAWEVNAALLDARIPDFGDSLYVAEVVHRVNEACTLRPVACRRVIVGIYGEGKSADQLAAELGKSAGNIRTIAHRTLHEIAYYLADRYRMRLSLAAIRACLAANHDAVAV